MDDVLGEPNILSFWMDSSNVRTDEWSIYFISPSKMAGAIPHYVKRCLDLIPPYLISNL